MSMLKWKVEIKFFYEQCVQRPVIFAINFLCYLVIYPNKILHVGLFRVNSNWRREMRRNEKNDKELENSISVFYSENKSVTGRIILIFIK